METKTTQQLEAENNHLKEILEAMMLKNRILNSIIQNLAKEYGNTEKFYTLANVINGINLNIYSPANIHNETNDLIYSPANISYCSIKDDYSIANISNGIKQDYNLSAKLSNGINKTNNDAANLSNSSIKSENSHANSGDSKTVFSEVFEVNTVSLHKVMKVLKATNFKQASDKRLATIALMLLLIYNKQNATYLGLRTACKLTLSGMGKRMILFRKLGYISRQGYKEISLSSTGLELMRKAFEG